jgi:hypothetical protein
MGWEGVRILGARRPTRKDRVSKNYFCLVCTKPEGEESWDFTPIEKIGVFYLQAT